MFNILLASPTSFLLSIAALAGVAVHDTKVDKLATTFAVPTVVASPDVSSKNFASDPHTHVERVSLADVRSSQPRIMPRSDQRKHLMQKNMPKGVQRYDGYSLPLA